jgi:hypothetical protein
MAAAFSLLFSCFVDVFALPAAFMFSYNQIAILLGVCHVDYWNCLIVLQAARALIDASTSV